jgi:hypothetical protein
MAKARDAPSRPTGRADARVLVRSILGSRPRLVATSPEELSYAAVTVRRSS